MRGWAGRPSVRRSRLSNATPLSARDAARRAIEGPPELVAQAQQQRGEFPVAVRFLPADAIEVAASQCAHHARHPAEYERQQHHDGARTRRSLRRHGRVDDRDDRRVVHLLDPGLLVVAAQRQVDFLVNVHLTPQPALDGGKVGRLLPRSEEHTSELQSRLHLVCRLLLEKKKKKKNNRYTITIQNQYNKVKY